MEVYSEPCQPSKIKFFAKADNDFQLLTAFARNSILDAWEVSVYPSALNSKTDGDNGVSKVHHIVDFDVVLIRTFNFPIIPGFVS